MLVIYGQGSIKKNGVYDQVFRALAEQTIQQVEALYHSLGVSTQLTEYEGERADAIDKIMQKLALHGLAAIGEHKAITYNCSREILEAAVA